MLRNAPYSGYGSCGHCDGDANDLHHNPRCPVEMEFRQEQPPAVLVYHGSTNADSDVWYGDRCKLVEEIPAGSWRGEPTNGEPGSIKYLYDALLVENLNSLDAMNPTFFIAPKSWFHAEVSHAA